MAKWRIAWTQVVGDAGAPHHIDEVDAEDAGFAILRWLNHRKHASCIDAVWRVGCEKVLQDAIGDSGAENGTSGKGRIIPEWVTRAKLVRYWRHAMQAAGVMDRASLETAFAAEYTSRWKAEIEYARLREKRGV